MHSAYRNNLLHYTRNVHVLAVYTFTPILSTLDYGENKIDNNAMHMTASLNVKFELQ